MVAKVTFWLLERSRLIAKASFSVMILKSLFLYSLFITWPCFTRKETPHFWPVERSFLIVSLLGNLKVIFLLRNVSFRATMSVSFSFICNSSSLRFGLIPWQFQNKIFKPIKVIKGYLSWMVMCYSGLLGGFRLFGDSLREVSRWRGGF